MNNPAAPTGTAARALARAREEADAVLAALVPTGDVHGSIHEARKAIRRLRALLQLVDQRLDVGIADRILQRTGDSLSALRDAHATIGTAERFARRDHERWQPVVVALAQRRDALLATALVQDPGFERRRSWVRRALARIEAAPWHRLKAADLRRGLERGRRRVDKARKRARRDADADADALHRWRRRVRKLRMQVEAVATIKPELLASLGGERHADQAERLHALSDRLGRRQDLDVLRTLLEGMHGLDDRDALLDQVREAEDRLGRSLGG